MKRISVAMALAVVVSMSALATTYVGHVKNSVRMRTGPGTGYGVITTLGKGCEVFIDDQYDENGFCWCYDYTNEREGYVSERYIVYDYEVEQKNNAFEKGERVYSEMAEVSVENNTSGVLSLVLDGESYRLSPHSLRHITVSPGYYSYRASEKGVIPLSGSQGFERGYNYTWEFYIRHERY